VWALRVEGISLAVSGEESGRVLLAGGCGVAFDNAFDNKELAMGGEGVIAVRAKLKRGKVRYVPMPPELATEFRRYPAVGEERIFPPEPRAKRERQRVDKSFETILDLVGITDFRFHDGRSNIKMRASRRVAG